MAKILGSDGKWYEGEVRNGRIYTKRGNTGVAPMGAAPKKTLLPYASAADIAYAAARPDQYNPPTAAQLATAGLSGAGPAADATVPSPMVTSPPVPYIGGPGPSRVPVPARDLTTRSRVGTFSPESARLAAERRVIDVTTRGPLGTFSPESARLAAERRAATTPALPPGAQTAWPGLPGTALPGPGWPGVPGTALPGRWPGVPLGVRTPAVPSAGRPATATAAGGLGPARRLQTLAPRVDMTPVMASFGLIPAGYEDPDVRLAERSKVFNIMARNPSLAPLLLQTEAVAMSRTLFGYRDKQGNYNPGAYDLQGNLVWPGLLPRTLTPTMAAAMGITEDQRVAMGYNPNYPYDLLRPPAGGGGGGRIGRLRGGGGGGWATGIGGGTGFGSRGETLPLMMWRI